MVITILAAPGIFEDADTDGYISKDEFKVRDDLVKNFNSIDKDKDGTFWIDEDTA